MNFFVNDQFSQNILAFKSFNENIMKLSCRSDGGKNSVEFLIRYYSVMEQEDQESTLL